ncbi:RadC-like JAB domain-containing protein [Daejeonella rubra]|uniref:RadC-like JAB domain-containing protein n=1 Tax=Daejeonella rubra TaxID=990371 RepID=A0A1G9M8A6_9SPHI|nr:JAB domain-containing protein [Daejeonella rubra]SDL70469.1 RadC-like JAB domain-containing protein [Daejeonella rubra]
MKKVSDIKIIYTPKIKHSKLPEIFSAHEAHLLFRKSWDIGKLYLVEQFKAMYLNSNGKVLGIYEISSGGLTYTQVDTRLIFLGAIKCCATSIILAHNHPSGNREPSDSDLRITRRLKEAGRLLEINIWDHLIITPEGYTSMRVSKIIR